MRVAWPAAPPVGGVREPQAQAGTDLCPSRPAGGLGDPGACPERWAPQGGAKRGCRLCPDTHLSQQRVSPGPMTWTQPLGRTGAREGRSMSQSRPSKLPAPFTPSLASVLGQLLRAADPGRSHGAHSSSP